jgi:hypothetical protein
MTVLCFFLGVVCGLLMACAAIVMGHVMGENDRLTTMEHKKLAWRQGRPFPGPRN